MSWDLACWRGRPTQPAEEVWKDLSEGVSVPFVPTFAGIGPALMDSLEREYGSQAWADEIDGAFWVRAAGWETWIRRSDYYIVVTCSYDLPKDDEQLEQLLRALLGAGLNVFDLQSAASWSAPESSI